NGKVETGNGKLESAAANRSRALQREAGNGKLETGNGSRVAHGEGPRRGAQATPVASALCRAPRWGAGRQDPRASPTSSRRSGPGRKARQLDEPGLLNGNG